MQLGLRESVAELIRLACTGCRKKSSSAPLGGQNSSSLCRTLQPGNSNCSAESLRLAATHAANRLNEGDAKPNDDVVFAIYHVGAAIVEALERIEAQKD